MKQNLASSISNSKLPWRKAIAVLSLFVLSQPLFADNLETPNPEDFYKDLQVTGENQKLDDLRSVQAELLIEKNEKKAMAQMQKLLRKYRNTPMEAGLWFRLAELHMRRAKAARFFEMNRKSETVVSLAPGQVKKASAKKSIYEAISIYDRIERRFKDFRDMDLVLFNSGFARQQVNKNAQARALYHKLIKVFPDSPLVADSHLAIGEMLFEEKKYKQAKLEYEAIKDFPESRIYPYGLYKLAWTFFNLEDAATGLKELEAVVAYSKTLASEEDSRLDLRKEALNDMVLFFSDVKPANVGVQYFIGQAGKEEAGFYILKLMRLYNRHGKYDNERLIFYDLVDELPTNNILPKAYVSMVTSFDQQKNRPQAALELENFAKLCSKDSTWGSSEGNSTKNCVTAVTKLSSNFGAKWHKLWLKNKHVPMLADVAERAYRNYLSFAIQGDKANLLHYEYANLLFQRKKYRKASDEYFSVAQKLSKQPMLHDASYAAIFSLQKAVGDKWQKQDEERYVVLATLYLDKNPKGKYREDIEFKRAFIIYDNGRYDEAAPLLVDLGEKYKNKPQGIKAQDLYLDILSKKKDYVKIKDYSQKLAKREKSKKRKLTLTKLYQESYFSSIDTMKVEGSELARADQFIKFAKENKSSGLAEKARWNAIQIYKKSDKNAKTANLAMAFSKDYKKSKLATDALKIATQNYEYLTNLMMAARAAEELIEKDKKDSGNWQKLAINYYTVEREFTKAERLLKGALKAPDKETQKWAITKLYELSKAKNDKSQEAYYAKFIDNLQIQPYHIKNKIAELKEVYANKEYPKAFKMAGDILKIKGDLSFYRAQARMIQAQILKREFVSQSMNARADRVALVIALKTEKLEKAQKAFQSVSRYKNPELVVEAFIELAELYGLYAKALKEMKLKDIPDAEAAAFYQEMENLAIPMQDRQVDTLLQAKEAAQQLKLGNDQLLKISKLLDKINLRTSVVFEVKAKEPGVQLPDVSGVGS